LDRNFGFKHVPHTNCGDKCPKECKYKDRSKIPEEIFLRKPNKHSVRKGRMKIYLFQLITRVKNYWRKEEIEEEGMLECLKRSN
jgi:hypothetical protein